MRDLILKCIVAAIMLGGSVALLWGAFHRDSTAAGLSVTGMTGFYWVYYLFRLPSRASAELGTSDSRHNPPLERTGDSGIL